MQYTSDRLNKRSLWSNNTGYCIKPSYFFECTEKYAVTCHRYFILFLVVFVVKQKNVSVYCSCVLCSTKYVESFDILNQNLRRLSSFRWQWCCLYKEKITTFQVILETSSAYSITFVNAIDGVIQRLSSLNCDLLDET